MWQRFTQILEMIRFSHTLFALPFALLAAVMAWRKNVAFFTSCWRKVWSLVSNSKAANDAPTIGGANELENR